MYRLLYLSHIMSLGLHLLHAFSFREKQSSPRWIIQLLLKYSIAHLFCDEVSGIASIWVKVHLSEFCPTTKSFLLEQGANIWQFLLRSKNKNLGNYHVIVPEYRSRYREQSLDVKRMIYANLIRRIKRQLSDYKNKDHLINGQY